MKRLLIMVSITTTIGLLSLTPTVRAADSPTCDFSADIAALAKLRADTAIPEEKRAREELDLRKNLFSQSLLCGKQELAQFKNLIDGLGTIKGKETLSVISTLRTKITADMDYYDRAAGHLDDLSLDDLRERARTVQSWRASEVSALPNLVTTTVLWAKNQSLFEKTEDRLGQIRQTVQSFQIIEGGAVQDIFEKASTAFLRAKDDNVRARQSLERSLPTEETLRYVKSSLDELKETYRIFFELSAAIEHLLPR